ncbi:Fc.00g022420.m01.CDS01 [Cosmosporella sp. VM-42]
MAQQFQSQPAAAAELQAQVVAAIRQLNFPAGLGGDASRNLIATGIIQQIDAVAFDKHNQSGIVEVHAVFTAERSDGTMVFRLEVIWDADTPPVGSTQTSHFGWEVYLDGNRVGGPGHVFFTPNVILTHYRMPGREQKEDLSLKLYKSGSMGAGKMRSETHYYRLE